MSNRMLYWPDKKVEDHYIDWFFDESLKDEIDLRRVIRAIRKLERDKR